MFEEERHGGLGASSPPVPTPANLPTKWVQKPLNKMTNEALNQGTVTSITQPEWRKPYKMDPITVNSLTRVR